MWCYSILLPKPLQRACPYIYVAVGRDHYSTTCKWCVNSCDYTPYRMQSTIMLCRQSYVLNDANQHICIDVYSLFKTAESYNTSSRVTHMHTHEYIRNGGKRKPGTLIHTALPQLCLLYVHHSRDIITLIHNSRACIWSLMMHI